MVCCDGGGPKKIRVCVDFKNLNKIVLKGVYPKHKVKTLALFTGVTKLNANSGFWQIPLAKDSTFITPHEQYCLTHCLLASQVPQSYFRSK